MTKKESCLARITETVNRDNGKTFDLNNSQRIPIIREQLAETSYIEEDLSLALLYSLKPISELKGKVIIVSSHIDTVREITKPFFELNGNMCKGTFDNALTNHVAIELMKRGDLSKKVIFAFTGDEEYGSGGAMKVAKYLSGFKDLKPRYLTLDITPNCSIYEYAVNLEYRISKKGLAKKIKKLMQDKNFNYGEFKTSKTSDETDMYSLYAKAASICIPVSGDYHSNYGVNVPYSSIIEYEEFLHELLLNY